MTPSTPSTSSTMSRIVVYPFWEIVVRRLYFTHTLTFAPPAESNERCSEVVNMLTPTVLASGSAQATPLELDLLTDDAIQMVRKIAQKRGTLLNTEAERVAALRRLPPAPVANVLAPIASRLGFALHSGTTPSEMMDTLESRLAAVFGLSVAVDSNTSNVMNWATSQLDSFGGTFRGSPSGLLSALFDFSFMPNLTNPPSLPTWTQGTAPAPRWFAPRPAGNLRDPAEQSFLTQSYQELQGHERLGILLMLYGGMRTDDVLTFVNRWGEPLGIPAYTSTDIRDWFLKVIDAMP